MSYKYLNINIKKIWKGLYCITMDVLKQIDNYIFEKIKEVNVYNFLNPINLEFENRKFLECFKKGIEYNPQYKYKVKIENYQSDFELIKEYKDYLEKKDNYIAIKMYNLLDELEQNLYLLNHIGDSRYITEFSKMIYGCHYMELIDKAYKILELDYTECDVLNLDSNYCKEQFKNVIKSNNLLNWNVELNEIQLAKVTVFPEKKEKIV